MFRCCKLVLFLRTAKPRPQIGWIRVHTNTKTEEWNTRLSPMKGQLSKHCQTVKGRGYPFCLAYIDRHSVIILDGDSVSFQVFFSTKWDLKRASSLHFLKHCPLPELLYRGDRYRQGKMDILDPLPFGSALRVVLSSTRILCSFPSSQQ